MKKVPCYEVVAPDPRRHDEAVYDLMAKVFAGAGGDYFAVRRWCRKVIPHKGSHFDWQTSRVALSGAHLLANYSVWAYHMRVGRARLRVGGIGCVATDGDYRKRGIQARTARASVEAMRLAGYDMSILFGIPDFYYRFGYVRAWSETSYEVPLAELRPTTPAPALKQLDLGRDAAAHRVYNRTHARLTGTAVRPTYPVHWHKQIRAYGWRDKSGNLLGYVRVRPRNPQLPLTCSEVAGDTELAIAAIYRLARRDGSDRVRFETLPRKHPVCERLRRGTCTEETRYRRCADAMVRTLNLESCLRKLQGEFARRLQASGHANWRGTLLINDARERVLLGIDRGRVRILPVQPSRHAVRGGEEIAQLIMGTDEPRATVAAAGIRLSGDAGKLLEVLFPNQHPALSAWDRY